MDKRRIISLSLAAALGMSTLTGCGSTIAGVDPKSVPMQPELTQQEVLDYYAKQLDYDTVIARNADPDINIYETFKVPEGSDRYNEVKEFLEETQNVLAKKEYGGTNSDRQHLPEDLYHYLKCLLNEKALSKTGTISNMERALGYYFVDVEYDLYPANIGEFTPAVTLVPMNGALRYLPENDVNEVNNDYIEAVIKRMNKYFNENNINAKAEYNSNDKYFSFSVLDESAIDFTDTTANETTQVVDTAPADNTGGSETAEDTTEATETTETTETTEVEYSNTQVIPQYKENYVLRQLPYDINLVGAVAGSGSYTSYVPRDLSYVYNLPDNDGIAGYALYPAGTMGLADFGFSQSKMDGTCTIRYLFMEDLEDPSKLQCTNAYVLHYNVKTGFSANNDNVIPTFLETEFKTLIDRADRAMVNVDITGLMAGNVFNDIGMGVLCGYQANYANVLKQVSTLRRIISRDMSNNSYLVEIESYRTEGAKSADLYPSYKDQVYAVIEQEGSKFVISDWMIMDRNLQVEPDIDPHKSTEKRIVSLGLTGEVSDETKEAAKTLMNDLYTSSTHRMVTGPYERDGVKYKRGMYDCFNSDPAMLPSTEREAFNSELRSLLVKYGPEIKSPMVGHITEFLGGTTNQVEFITEELITYQGRTSGMYRTCYYLISCMRDTWVIDDVQVMSLEEVSGEALNSIKGRFTGE